MLGLGETDQEIRDTMADLRELPVDILTLGQYLRPTANHLNIERFVTPDEFGPLSRVGAVLRVFGMRSGPLVRSSYRAEQALARNNARPRQTAKLPAAAADVRATDVPRPVRADDMDAAPRVMHLGDWWVRTHLAGDAEVHRRPQPSTPDEIWLIEHPRCSRSA